VFVRERGAVVRGWGGRRRPRELEGGGRGGRSLRAVVRGSRVVGWVFGRGLWRLYFILSVERERGFSLTGRTKTTNDDEYHRRSSSGCHVAIGTWHLVCRPSYTSPSLVVVHGRRRSSFRDGRPSSWTLPSTWHARVNRRRATSTVSWCRLLAVAGVGGERGAQRR
jgi:hypothetical protein